MMEKLQKMKQKSFEEKETKWTAARIRELRGLSLAKKAATMNDEDYRKFKESPEYLKSVRFSKHLSIQFSATILQKIYKSVPDKIRRLADFLHRRIITKRTTPRAALQKNNRSQFSRIINN